MCIRDRLGHRVGGHGHRPGRVGPGLRSEFVDEVGGSPGRSRVVPQQSWPDDLALCVEGYHAVLLATDGNGGHIVQAARVDDGSLQGGPPVLRVDLGAVRMGGAAGAHPLPGRRIADDDLARLGAGIDSGDQGANGCLLYTSRCV